MLYDPKWDQVLVDWVSTKDPAEKYDYGNTYGKCIIAQFSQHLGPANASWRSENPAFYRRLYNAATGWPRTMGGALARFML